MVTTLKKIKYNNKDVQVESAVRDGNGNIITSTYVTSVNNVSPTNGNVTLTIPSAVTESTVSGWGFTKNSGTVVGSGLTANYFVVGNGTTNVKISSLKPTTSSTSWSTTSDVNVPTMKAISAYVTGLGYTSNTGTITKVQLNGVDVATSGTANITALPLSGGTMTGDINWSSSAAWLKPYLLAFKNADTSSSPTHPYTGFYQWGTQWQVNARDVNNNWSYNLLTIDLETKVANFAARPTVGSESLAYASDVPSSTKGITYLTTAPTAANTDGGLIIVVLSSEPATKYSGYIYLITEA